MAGVGIGMSVNKESKPSMLPGYFSSPLTDEIPWEEILEDGTIVFCDGSLGCGYRLSPLYLDSMTDAGAEEVEAVVCAALSSLDGRRDISLQIVWEKSSRRDVLNAVAQSVSARDGSVRRLAAARYGFWESKLNNAEVFDLRCSLFVRLTFEGSVPASSYVGIDMTKKGAALLKAHEQKMKTFAAECSRLARSLDRLSPVKMNCDEVYESMWRALFGSSPAPRYDRLAAPARNHFCGRDIEMSRKHGYISLGDGGRNVAVMSLHSLPDVSWMQMMGYLAVVEFPVRISMYITPGDTGAMRRGMELKLRRAMSYASVFSPASRMIAEELEKVGFDLEKGNKLVNIEMYVAIEGDTARSLSERVQFMRSKGLEIGATFSDEHIALWPCWLSTLPGMLSPGRTDRRHTVKTDNAVNLAPILGGREPEQNGTFIMRGPCSQITTWDMFSPLQPANHGLIFGSTGSGKSFFTSMMILSAMAREPNVFIVDKGGSYRRLVSLLDGDYIEVASGRTAFNPFELPEGENPDERIPFWCSVVSLMCDDEDIGKAYAAVIIERCVQALAMELRRRRETEPDAQVTVSDAWRILDMHVLYDKENKEAHLAEVQAKLRTLLSRWTHAGTKGTSWHCKLLDCPRTTVNIQNSHVVAFDVNGVEVHPEILRVVFLVISDLIRRKAQKNPEVRKLIIFDEVWSVFRSREGAVFIEELFRTMRKYNAAVWAISQDITDFADSDVGAAVMSNVYNKIIMRQSSDTSREHIQKHLGLNESEMWLLTTLRSRKGEFSEVLLSTPGSTCARMGIYPSPQELWMATTDAEDVSMFNEFIASSGMSPMDAVFHMAKKYPAGVAGGESGDSAR